MQEGQSGQSGEDATPPYTSESGVGWGCIRASVEWKESNITDMMLGNPPPTRSTSF